VNAALELLFGEAGEEALDPVDPGSGASPLAGGENRATLQECSYLFRNQRTELVKIAQERPVTPVFLAPV
jgi:hypothetical protein